MKKYRYLIYIFCILFLVGCERGSAPEEKSNYIYYVNADSTGLVKEEYQIPDTGTDEQIKQMLYELQKDTDTIDYKSAYPEKVRIQSWKLKDTDLEIDFSKSYADMDASTEVLLRAATVQSLVQIKKVDYVKFTIDGEELKDREGKEVGYMNRDVFVTNTGSSLHTYQDGNIRLFFANAAGDGLVEEDISVRYNSNMSIEKLIVEQLIKGPFMDDSRPVISPHTKILGLSVKEGICYVNFDEEFLNTKYDVSPQVTVYAIVNSIAEAGGASQVQILVNGEKNITYKDRISLAKPFSRNLEMIDEKEEN